MKDNDGELLLARVAGEGVRRLHEEDPELYDLLSKEYRRQTQTLALVASCSPTHPSVLACEGTFTSNVTAEGYPGARFHAGCVYVDQFEQLAIDRSKQAFSAQYANVQPHTASIANTVVMTSLLKPGDTLLGMNLDSGGHLSHGSKVNISGSFFNSVGYGLTPEGVLDYDRMAELAREHKPKLIICGTTAYPRTIDWRRFRAVADEVGAYVLADITHIAGLVIAGIHPSPIDIAHITTTCTHKQLYGPRGGLILIGKEHASPGPDGKTPLSSLMQNGLFPFIQGAPIVNNIVAKSRALARSMSPEFASLARRIVELSRALSAALMERNVRVISGGSDNHIVVMDVLSSFGVTGVIAEQALEECGIIVNRNRIVGDQKPPRVTSGVRIGTNSLAAREFTAAEMQTCAALIAEILKTVKPRDDRSYDLPPSDRERFQSQVRALAAQHPIPGYPAA
jgi:glycine hydroxymethyltransferase